jgi:sortase A
MATKDDNDDSNRSAKRKGLTLQPLTNDIPAAQVPATPITTTDELEELRQQISALGETADKQVETAVQEFSIPEEAVIEDAVAAPTPKEVKDKRAAISLVRAKLKKLYAHEPDAVDESIESFQAGLRRSKHQQFMYDLTNSGKGLAQIQTEWHAYYSALPDAEKHEVWQEFYQAHDQHLAQAPLHAEHQKHNMRPQAHDQFQTPPPNDTRTVADLKKQVVSRVTAGGKLSAKHHLQSLLFGMGMASIFVVLLLFSFFNERFIAPFMSPSRDVSATPIVGNTGAVGPEPKIIIPKINLEVPVVYDVNTTEEKSVQAGLERGVVHYSTSPSPGQTGNVVIVGHSSNNILNKGQYKFAFVLLKRLEVGDTFSLNKDGVRYTYQIFDKKIVKPTDVSVLGTLAKPNTATLITCDPPGTSLNRLIVVGEQISPDPNSNKTVDQKAPPLTDKGVLPSNAPSMWQRIKNLF